MGSKTSAERVYSVDFAQRSSNALSRTVRSSKGDTAIGPGGVGQRLCEGCHECSADLVAIVLGRNASWSLSSVCLSAVPGGRKLCCDAIRLAAAEPKQYAERALSVISRLVTRLRLAVAALVVKKRLERRRKRRITKGGCAL